MGKIHWNVDDLVPAITQDHETECVLMVAWMNHEALVLATSGNHITHRSCSRGKLWHKDEESGHVQKLHKSRLDYDTDVIILMVEQVDGIACRTDWESCLYRVFENGAWKTADPVLKGPNTIYKHAGHYHD